MVGGCELLCEPGDIHRVTELLEGRAKKWGRKCSLKITRELEHRTTVGGKVLLQVVEGTGRAVRIHLDDR
jgi:hypothetical protein